MSSNLKPRLVHAGVKPIGTADSSGVTLASVLEDWPQNALLQVCLRDAPVDRDFGSLYVMPPNTYPLNRLAHAILRGRTIRANHHQMHNAVANDHTSVTLKTRMKMLARDINDIGPVHVNRSFRSALTDFRPELVHSLLGTVREMRVTLALSESLNIPILPHFTDDWPSTIYGDGQLLGYPRWEARRLLSRILERSPVLLTIGSDMAAEFSSRYGKRTAVVGNCSMTRPEPAESTGNVMVYAGGLHLGRAEVIGKIADIVDASGNPGRLTIDLFTSANDLELAQNLEKRHKCINSRGTMPPSSIVQRLSSSAAALFVESAEQRILDYTRLSVSTKVPEYLASLSPIVAVGPRSQSSVSELLKAPQTIYAGDGSDRNALASAVATLTSDRASYANRARFPSWYSRAETSQRFSDAAKAAVVDWKKPNG